MTKKPKPQPSGKQTPRDHPGPWGSVLWNHLEEIRDLRRKRKRWDDIAVHLEKERGVKLTSRAIRNFFARAVKAKLPLGFEPIPPPPSQSISSTTPAPSVIPTPSPQPNSQAAAREALRARAAELLKEPDRSSAWDFHVDDDKPLKG